MKLKKMVAVLVALLFCLPIAKMLADEDENPGEDMKLSLEFSGLKIGNLPLDIRYVPIHPDDGYASESSNGPILKNAFSICPIASSQIGKPIYMAKSGLKVCARWLLYPHFEFYKELRNYTDAPGTERRGDSAALTFVGLRVGGIIPPFINTAGVGILDLLFNVTPEISWEPPSLAKQNLALTLSYFQIQAVNGWDRYDKLEVNKRYVLAHCLPISIKYKPKGGGIGGALKLYPIFGDKAGIKSSFGVEINNLW